MRKSAADPRSPDTLFFSNSSSSAHLTPPFSYLSISGGESDSEAPRKVLRREEEPEEYWKTPGERKGESPLKDPLAIIGILSILFPFILLAIAFPAGWIDPSGFR